MRASETASISIRLSDKTDLAECILETSPRTPPAFNEAYFRLHKNPSDNIRLRVSNGAIKLRNSGLYREVIEYVSFLNSENESLQYFNASNVKIKSIGGLYDINGESVKYSYDGVLKRIITPKKCFGLLQVKYNSYYQLWLAHFSGNCQYNELPPPSNPDSDTESQGLEEMVIFAFLETQYLASITLSPPACIDSEFVQLDRELPNIVIDIDPDDPITITKGLSTGLEAACTLRIFSLETLHFVISSGFVYPLTAAGQSHSLAVKESLVFNNSSSAQLKYSPLNGNISINTSGDYFIDRWNDNFLPQIKKPGEKVKVVEWIDQNRFKNPIEKIVGDKEIIVTKFPGFAMESYGFANVTYSTKYVKYKYNFVFDDEIRRFKESFLLVKTNDGKTGSIQLKPPQMTGLN